MGWTYIQRGSQKVKDILRRELSYTDGSDVLEIAIVNLREAYAAVRTPKGKVVGIVAKLDYAKDRVHDFGFKVMDEGEGPLITSAPAKVLDLLSPVNAIYKTPLARDFATKWRTACRERLAKREDMKLEVGDRIHFNGSLWELVQGGRRKRFARVPEDGEVIDNPALFRLVDWKKYGKRA